MNLTFSLLTVTLLVAVHFQLTASSNKDDRPKKCPAGKTTVTWKCNTCKCLEPGGDVGPCTEIWCASIEKDDKPKKCRRGKKSVPWECNTCYCAKRGGKVGSCTLKMCSSGEEQEVDKGRPKKCPPAETTVHWGCNTCKCDEPGGEVGPCTEVRCEKITESLTTQAPVTMNPGFGWWWKKILPIQAEQPTHCEPGKVLTVRNCRTCICNGPGGKIGPCYFDYRC